LECDFNFLTRGVEVYITRSLYGIVNDLLYNNNDDLSPCLSPTRMSKTFFYATRYILYN
jgi:hypothetical protein